MFLKIIKRDFVECACIFELVGYKNQGSLTND